MRRGGRDCLALAALVIAVHWPHLSGWLSENPLWLMSGLSQGTAAGHGVLTGYPGWIDGNAGVTTQALGGLAARDWLHCSIPWWNPYSGIGLPLAAELQNSAFFLPFVLLLHGTDGVITLKIVLQIAAGWSCYALLAELGRSRLARCAGAACFALNGSFAWFGHGPIMPIAFLPLLLFGIERARRRRWQGAALIGTAIGWSLLSGFPETAYLDGLLGLAWAILRVARHPAGARWSLAATVAAGGAAGVALAAPPLLAFIQSLPISFVGNHVNFAAAHVPPASRAPLLLPYLFGPPMYGGLRSSGVQALAQFIQWYRTAPYLDLPLLLLAACAVPLRHQRQDAGLRWLLTGWTLFALARVLGVPVLQDVVNAVPLARQTMVHLYILPSCQLAVTVLASFALDDWRAEALSPRRLACCTAAIAALALASLPPAWPVLADLGRIAGFGWYPLLSIVGVAVLLIAMAALLGATPSPRRARALAVLLVSEAALLFFIPLLAGTPRPRTLDTAAIAYLRAQPGPLRVQSIGALTPNYGAWFAVASIDHNYLPVPQNWVDDVRAGWDPAMDGANNWSTDTSPAGLTALAARLPALAARGVGALILPAAAEPFVATATIPVTDHGNIAAPLTHPTNGFVAGARILPGTLRAVSFELGTYGGAARGSLQLRICQATRCAEASRSLAGAPDNAVFALTLDPPLALAGGAALTWSLRAEPGTVAPALWLWPQTPTADLREALRDGRAPRLQLIYAPPPGAPVRVYADRSVAIYRMTNTAPYFQAPNCQLSFTTRTALHADCSAASRLLRLELAYPGWRAQRRGGGSVAVTADGVFQTIALPAGASDWRFTYAPPGVAAAWCAAALGAAALTAFAWAGRPHGGSLSGHLPTA